GEDRRHHGLGDPPGRRHGGAVAALVDGLGRFAGPDVHRGQRPGHGGDRLHRDPDPHRLTCGHPTFYPAGPVGAPPDSLVARLDLVVCLRSAPPGRGEAVAHLHALHPLDPHHPPAHPPVAPPPPV